MLAKLKTLTNSILMKSTLMNNSQLPKYENADSPGQPIELADRADFIDAMSRVANSVNVVTTNGAAGQVGVTVSAATSVTAEPPTILVCIHELSKAVPAIKENGVFCLNVLESEQQAFSQLFAGQAAEEPAERFSAEDWTVLKTGSPVLKDGLAIFDCRVDTIHKEGTHYIFIGQVLAAKKGDGLPLVYSQRAYAKPDWGNAKPAK